MKSPSPPAAPDPVATANAQGQTNKETAYWNAVLNRVNQETPYGTLKYVQSGDGKYNPEQPPQFTAVTELTPEGKQRQQQEIALDLGLNQLSLDQLGRVKDSLATPFNYEGIPTANYEDFGGDRKRVEDALYERQMSRLAPEFDSQERSLKQQLYNRGLSENSDAYKEAMMQATRAKNDALEGARVSTIQQGGAEQSRLYSLAQNARERAIQERMSLRSQPLNEAVALMGGGGGVQMPTFTSVPQEQAASPDLMGAVYNSYAGQMQNYNQRMQSRNSTMGAIGGLFGSAMGSPWIGSAMGFAAGAK